MSPYNEHGWQTNWLLKCCKHLLENSDYLVSTRHLHYLWNYVDQKSIEILHERKVKVMNTSYTVKLETTDYGAKCQWQLICIHLFPQQYQKPKVILLAYTGRAVSYKPKGARENHKRTLLITGEVWAVSEGMPWNALAVLTGAVQSGHSSKRSEGSGVCSALLKLGNTERLLQE